MSVNMVTPIEYFDRIGETEVYIKRDDLLPFSFGGNKVRILLEVFEEMEKRGNRRLISYGSTSSNLNRAAAQMAAQRGVPCTIIVKKEGTDSGHPSFNEIMVLDSGAEIIYSEAADVRETVANTLARYRTKGEEPYYIYGDESGKGGEEVLFRAYRNAAEEIRKQEEELGLRFDTLVLPVGTGATVSGLIEAEDGKKILGISIAREKDKILEGLPREKFREELHYITDEYRMGGYGRRSPELVPFLREQLRAHGLPLDPVYSGKAFYAMTEEIRKGNLSGACLFIHTGGIPLFFDMMEQL